MKITFEIPEVLEASVKNAVSIVVENHIKSQIEVVKVEDTVEYKQAVDSFRLENNMEAKFAESVIEPVIEPVSETL